MLHEVNKLRADMRMYDALIVQLKKDGKIDECNELITKVFEIYEDDFRYMYNINIDFEGTFEECLKETREMLLADFDDEANLLSLTEIF